MIRWRLDKHLGNGNSARATIAGMIKTRVTTVATTEATKVDKVVVARAAMTTGKVTMTE